MRRSTFAIVGLATATVLLTGCGVAQSGTAYKAPAGTDVALTPAAVVKAASTATSRAGSARLSLTLTTDLGSTPSTFSVVGPVALDGSTADLTATIPGKAFGTDGAITVRQIVVDDVAYLKLEGSDILPPTWLKVDVGEALTKAGVGALGDVTGGTGVADQLAALKTLGDVTTLGREQVNGVTATHYRATIDPAKVAASLEAASKLAGTDAALGAATIPVDLWIDDQGRIVRVTQTFTPGATAGKGTQGSVSWEMNLSDFGVPLSVTAPAGALDLGGMLSGLGDLAGALNG
jgi:hypothetical protein